MKRILKFLAGLYPSAWRARYGAEYEALLEQGTPRARDAFDVFWGALKMQATTWSLVRIVLPCALVGVLVAIAISFTVPTLYRSRTLISASTTGYQPLDKEIAGQVDDWLTRPFLISVIQEQNLYPRERARMPMSAVVELMGKNIKILASGNKNDKPASAFVVQFDYPEPRAAQRVDEALVSRLMAANLRARISSASATSDFLKEQLAVAKDPAIKARIQLQLRQAEAAALQWPGALRVVNEASLPRKPMGLSRTELGMIGMFAGLLSGLALAMIVRARHNSTAAGS